MHLSVTLIPEPGVEPRVITLKVILSPALKDVKGCRPPPAWTPEAKTPSAKALVCVNCGLVDYIDIPGPESLQPTIPAKVPARPITISP